MTTNAARSPDGRKLLEAKTWLIAGNPRIDLVLTEGGKTLFQTTVAVEREVRYVKLAWSPASDTALVGLGRKFAQDLLLIRLAGGKASSASFDSDKTIVEKMLETLPFRDDIKSSAPVGRVPWKTVSWRTPNQCTMTFIYRGIGYEGTAQVVLDFSGTEPQLTVASVEPKVAAGLWKQD